MIQIKQQLMFYQLWQQKVDFGFFYDLHYVLGKLSVLIYCSAV